MDDCNKYFNYIYTFIMFNLPYFFVYWFNFESIMVLFIYIFVGYQSLVKDNIANVIKSNLDEKLVFLVTYATFFQFIILTSYIVLSGLSGTLDNYTNNILFVCLCYSMTILNFIMIVKLTNKEKH